MRFLGHDLHATSMLKVGGRLDVMFADAAETKTTYITDELN